MASVKRTVNPTLEPVSLADQMAHARIFDTHEGALIEGYITAARIVCENKIGQAFVTSTYQKQIDRFPCATRLNPHAAIHIDRPPLQSVTSIVYVAQDGTSTTMASSDYTVNTNAMPGFVTPAYGHYWPTMRFVPNAVTITYQAGYGGAGASATTSVAAVPEPAKLAIKVLAQHFFQERDTNAVAPQAIDALLSTVDHGNYRVAVPEDYV